MNSSIIKERPILMSAPMVRAILDGRKTQTRRILNPQPDGGVQIHPFATHGVLNMKGDNLVCRLGTTGDRLWVRETWQGPLFYDEIPEDWNSDKYKTPDYCHYKASGHSCDFTDADDNYVERWSPSIHMPRWASRILLEITNVRVERLLDISEEDAIAEGVEPWCAGNGFWRDYSLTPDQEMVGSPPMTSAKDSYQTLWESINGQGAWDLNPFVWILEFKVISK